MNTVAVAPINIHGRAHLVAGWLAVALLTVIPLSNALTIVISILLAIFCLFSMQRQQFIAVLRNPVSIAILFFLLISILNSMFTVAAKPELFQAFKKYSRLLYFPLLLPLFTQVRWQHAALTGFLSAVFISVVAAMLHPEQAAVFKDSIFTSLFVAFAIFILAHYSVADHNYGHKYRWLTLPIAIFFTYYLFFINIGRAGQGLFVMLFLLFMWQRVPRVLKSQLIALLVLISVLAASALLPSSFNKRQQVALQEIQHYAQRDQLADPNVPLESSMGTRLILAQNSFELVKKKPLLGWGTGAFKAAYAQYAPEAQATKIVRANPHNQYLLTWVELGLPGILCLLYMFYALTSMFLRCKQLSGYLGLGFMLCIVVGCSMNSWLLDFTSMFFFVCFAALFVATVSVPQAR